MKKCVKCNIEKELSCFQKDNKLKSGHRSKCKKCMNEETKIRRLKNADHIKEIRKKYYQNNREKLLLEKKKYNSKNKDKKALYDKKYREQNKEKIAAYKKQWHKLKFENDIIYKIKRNLRRRIHHALNGKTKSKATLELLGCTPEFFKVHIENQFIDNMSWENYGEWHIDHIIPCFTFDLSCPKQQKKCFHYSNQRPLWAKDNLSRPKST